MGNLALESKLSLELQLAASVSPGCFCWILKPQVGCYLGNVMYSFTWSLTWGHSALLGTLDDWLKGIPQSVFWGMFWVHYLVVFIWMYLLSPVYSFIFTCYILNKFIHLKLKNNMTVTDHSSRLDRIWPKELTYLQSGALALASSIKWRWW